MPTSTHSAGGIDRGGPQGVAPARQPVEARGHLLWTGDRDDPPSPATQQMFDGRHRSVQAVGVDPRLVGVTDGRRAPGVDHGGTDGAQPGAQHRVAVAIDHDEPVEAGRHHVEEPVAFELVGHQREHERRARLGERVVGAAEHGREVGVGEDPVVGLVDDQPDQPGAAGHEAAGVEVRPVVELEGRAADGLEGARR